MCSRPAVSTSTASNPSSRADSTAPFARAATPVPGSGSCTRTPASRASTPNCSMAAGRRTSVDTTSACRPCRSSHLASLTVVVVFPAPCSPSSSTTCGRWRVGASPPSPSPSSARSSSRTMATTCWVGVRLSRTAPSTARSRTRSMKARTTLKLTSASRRARRISRSAVSTDSGVSRASRRTAANTDCSRSLSEPNICHQEKADQTQPLMIAPVGLPLSNANRLPRQESARACPAESRSRPGTLRRRGRTGPPQTDFRVCPSLAFLVWR